MAGTSCLSIVKSGVQRTNQRQSRLVGLLGGGLADGAWKRSSGHSFPPRILALARQPNVLSLEPPGNGRRYTSITSIPFLRSSSVNSRVARLSVIRRRILSNGPILETLLRPSLRKSVTTLTSFAERIITLLSCASSKSGVERAVLEIETVDREEKAVSVELVHHGFCLWSDEGAGNRTQQPTNHN